MPEEARKREFMVTCASGAPCSLRLRKHRRFPIRMHVVFELIGATTAMEAFSEDLSATGLFLRTPLTLSVRTPISLRIGAGPRQPPIELRGHVAWVRHHPPTAGFGVRLEPRGGPEMKRLRRLMRQLKGCGRLVESAA
jgi:hypothetical protein